ncbi:MAG: DNA polymerase II large subunit [Candidatus Hermodarchaeota archaeon]
MIEFKFQEYIQSLKETLKTQVQLAKKARAQKHDPNDQIESKLTYSSKDKITAILNIPGMEEYLPQNLSHHENILLLAADMAKQIVNGRFVKKSREELVLLALHSALVILSRGLISVPQESIPKVEIGSKSNHLTVYFSNTIRYASGETIGLVLLIADYIRHILHFNRFNSSPEVLSRYIEEMEIFLALNDRSQDLRKDLIELYVQNIGVELSGEAFERIEVKIHRNLPNVTNQLRMGMCVALDKMIEEIDIIAHRRIITGIPEWDWLRPPFKKKRKTKQEFRLQEVRGIQPLISKSKKPGGFRLRYGRSRNIGHGAAGVHPCTMYLSQMLSPGSSIKIDFMDQPLTVFPVSSLLGPFVELNDGSSVRIDSFSKMNEIEHQIVQIWEMGDILLSPDDIPARETMEMSAWTEEWWCKETHEKIVSKGLTIEKFALLFDISIDDLVNVIKAPMKFHPSPELALLLCNQTNVPLHPYYSFNWNEIAISDLMKLLQKLDNSESDLLAHDTDLQEILKQLGVPFNISDDKIYAERFKPYLKVLRGKSDHLTQILSKSKEPIEIDQLIHMITGIHIRSLCQQRIGLKIIRAEKAEYRQINPPAHSLFPIGSYGGTQRDFLKAMNESDIRIQLAERFCPICEFSSFQIYCPECGQETNQQYTCINGHTTNERLCKECGQYGYKYSQRSLNISNLLEQGFEKTGPLKLNRIKGVSFLNSKNRIPEHITKGILRSKHDLFVYKDGTSRFDQTNAPLTHFTPKEINISIKDLRQLGYSHDIFGNDLMGEDQLIELFPYDVIVSRAAGEFLVRLSNFIDDELRFLYELSPYYRINSLDNIIGLLIVSMSPFSTVATIGRIIGYTENNVVFAHPLWHWMKTRTCNGDIDSMTLLLDVLLNFSIEFIPAARGGAMDVPFIINLLDEWQDAIAYSNYDSIILNLLFYHALKKNPLKEELLSYTQSYLTPSYPKYQEIDNISHYHFNNRFRESKIVSKIETALQVLQRIRGIKEGEFVDSILEYDFLEKITNSIDRFFLQPVRCKRCKTTYRRIPLTNKCPICHQETIGLTLSEGWVLRHLQIINQLKEKYDLDLSDYSKSWIELIELNKRLLFDKGPRPTTLV